MRSTAATTRVQSAALIIFLLGIAFSPNNSVSHDRVEAFPPYDYALDSSSRADNCAACHQRVEPTTLTLFETSAHGRAGKTCSTCHGGDPSAAEKSAAHSGQFTGSPSDSEVLSMCGGCHVTVVSMFKSSRHFQEQKSSNRVGCIDCHGAHGIGSPQRNFSYSYYCAGCHGLEYLPRIPDELQKVLSLSDELGDLLRGIQSSGQRLSNDITMRRRALRGHIAEVVHSTDVKGGTERGSALAADLRSLIEHVKKQVH